MITLNRTIEHDPCAREMVSQVAGEGKIIPDLFSFELGPYYKIRDR